MLYAWKAKSYFMSAIKEETLIYKTIDDHELSTLVFHQPGKKHHAVMVLFHGGGWVGAHPRAMVRFATHFANLGFVVFCPTYRVKKIHGTSPIECLADANDAIAWVSEQAERFQFPVDQMIVGGSSAGGHLAAASFFAKAFACGDKWNVLRKHMRAFLLFNPVLDIGSDGYGHSRLKDHFEAISPLHCITDEVPPPTLIFHGTKDSIVSYASAERFYLRMREFGHTCYLHTFHGDEHTFHKYKDNYEMCIFHMDRFLAELGFLEQPERKGFE